jgi:hypothetical protein
VSPLPIRLRVQRFGLILRTSTGSVSVAVWSIVCKRVIGTAEDLVKDWLPSPATLFAKTSPSAGKSVPRSRRPGRIR